MQPLDVAVELGMTLSRHRLSVPVCPLWVNKPPVPKPPAPRAELLKFLSRPAVGRLLDGKPCAEAAAGPTEDQMESLARVLGIGDDAVARDNTNQRYRLATEIYWNRWEFEWVSERFL